MAQNDPALPGRPVLPEGSTPPVGGAFYDAETLETPEHRKAAQADETEGALG